MAVLKPKHSQKMARYRVSLPAVLVEEMADVQAKAEEKGLIFDVAEIVQKALYAAVKNAKDELMEGVR